MWIDLTIEITSQGNDSTGDTTLFVIVIIIAKREYFGTKSNAECDNIKGVLNTLDIVNIRRSQIEKQRQKKAVVIYTIESNVIFEQSNLLASKVYTLT